MNWIPVSVWQWVSKYMSFDNRPTQNVCVGVWKCVFTLCVFTVSTISASPCSCLSRFTQMDCDGHLAQCLSEVNVDVTWWADRTLAALQDLWAAQMPHTLQYPIAWRRTHPESSSYGEHSQDVCWERDSWTLRYTSRWESRVFTSFGEEACTLERSFLPWKRVSFEILHQGDFESSGCNNSKTPLRGAWSWIWVSASLSSWPPMPLIPASQEDLQTKLAIRPASERPKWSRATSSSQSRPVDGEVFS